VQEAGVFTELVTELAVTNYWGNKLLYKNSTSVRQYYYITVHCGTYIMVQ